MKQLMNPFGLMVILNLCLLGYIVKERSASKALAHFSAVESISEAKLDRVYGEEPTAGMAGTLYIFAHADGECDCLDDWVHWVQAHEELEGRIAIKAVFNGQDLEKLVSFAEEMSFPFPVYQDLSGTLHREARVEPGRISKMLVSRDNRIVFADTYQVNKRDQQYFLRRLKDHVDRLEF